MKNEPPDLSLASDIANRGEEANGPVLVKLKSTSNEGDQYDLIYVLEVMSERGYLRGKKDVIAQISNVIDGMKPIL
jgi:hypothetical protein